LSNNVPAKLSNNAFWGQNLFVVAHHEEQKPETLSNVFFYLAQLSSYKGKYLKQGELRESVESY
jgi:hypothetical protein